MLLYQTLSTEKLLGLYVDNNIPIHCQQTEIWKQSSVTISHNFKAGITHAVFVAVLWAKAKSGSETEGKKCEDPKKIGSKKSRCDSSLSGISGRRTPLNCSNTYYSGDAQ